MDESSRFDLVAVDLDGTLLTSSRTIEEANKKALLACFRAGIAVAIVTGRRLPSARIYVDLLPFEPFVVANSGAFVLERHHILRRSLLPLETGERVLAVAAELGIEPVVHDGPNGEGHLILREKAQELPHVGRYVHQTIPPPVWVRTLELERDPVQIGFAASLEDIRKLHTSVSKRISNVSAVRTEYPAEDLALLDVLAVDANKSQALSFLSQHIGIPMSRTLAIGDNWNDVDMLEAAGQGVVMANAASELKQRGFAETTSNDEAGVARAIEKFVLEREASKPSN